MAKPVPTFHGFAGQRDIVRVLRQHAEGALSAGRPMLHVCLNGPSGIGKTSLAKAVAKEMRTDCHDVYGSPGLRPWQLARAISAVKKADIVFIDEAHALCDATQEVLYPAIDRQKVPLVEDGKLIQGEWVDIPEFTLVVATDQLGTLKNALQQRLPLKLTLGYYLLPEMRVIVGNRAAELGLPLKPQAITRLAEAARGVPRKAGHFLLSLQTCLGGSVTAPLTRAAVDRHLAGLGIDRHNLDESERRYLGALGRRATHVSLTTLSLELGLDEAHVRRQVESILLREELIAIAPNGRCLTQKGVEHVEREGLK